MSTDVRSPGEGPGRQRILGIYLNDHLAGATAGVELARRMVQEHGDTPYGEELRSLEAEISQDRRALLRLMTELHAPARRYKVYGAWVGEKLARVKPNGRLLRRSGLTVLVELEALRTGITGKAMLWHSLLSAAPAEPRLDSDRLEELLRRAERQITRVDELHDRAASALLSPAGARPAAVRAAADSTPGGNQV
ncbi:hypothetical protein [Streptomyces griseorubiginosus]|uniref:hypothetical protein n=1 Tax=Streptomyces griseorubiginosus TaxID=67304 RepID=UPI001AD77C5B|nr:hypothetical protein [Streptomyces griseorubiginosus]MBO4252720.1 hypothetical protein [Streptomyces griseorubiginosus]